ncbi:MAG: aldehyde:ferredoxin oxidoreductase [Deltaproteobacteria bacterium]|nr:aldehyde:ferredoxin oxidoreductase [Deltaproteobacteria bacterium]MBW1929846.1 aldehyde:ferredoxin oxidoreductase [Deltaproteobacteria bacterium]MBW2124368.1 aldehyde:ferredoxin oxidoreductase [Deltaproteobacteria bacterium]RLB17132.1 MAG: aldehyde:ferredoxin oxidoreductase [Deltaproteobacteria bacterium]
MVELNTKEIKTTTYKRPEIERGYANQTLCIDLSRQDISIKPVSEKMKEVFVGGKGFDLWLLWNAVRGKTKWNDPENAICIASGPLGGTPTFPGSGKSIVTTISPTTGSVMDSNVGGYFGPYLKFSGFDALEVVGKGLGDTVILIDGIEQKIQILEIPGLPDDSYSLSAVLTDFFADGKKQDISVVSTGPGARHTLIGCLNFTWYDVKRKRVRYKQAGRGGIGTVFADKGIKAIVARWDSSVTLDTNHPADKEALKAVSKAYSREIRELDPKQNEMARIGTTHLVPIMNDFDLLPTHNFRYGQHPGANNIGREVYQHLFDPGFDGCWKGCAVACAHGVKDFVPMTGPYKGQKVFVDGPEYETIAGCGSNIGVFDPFTILEMNFYCDAYGLDTISVGTSIAFAMECFELGLITKEHTGGMDLSFGNRLSALELLHQMARGEGFGAIVGQGVRRMKEIFEKEYGADPNVMNDIGMESKGLEFSEYMTKESLAQQGGYGLALKGPQHDEAWLIFLDMVHNYMPTFEQKAEALHWFPMFRTWFGLCGLCKLPWNDIVPEDNKETPEPAKVMKHVQWYADYFRAVTGRNVTPDDLIRMSEAVYNFQRIFNLRMGYGRREHDSVPYRAMGPVTVEEYESRQDRYDKQLVEKYGVDITGKETAEKLAILRKFREEQYERLKDAVYERRGWTKDGIPTLKTVKRLGIDFPEVLEVLRANGVES